MPPWTTHPQAKAIQVNKIQMQSRVKDGVDQVQEETGKLVGRKVQEAKGLKNQAEGKTEKALGDLKEVTKDAKDAFKDTTRR